MEDTKLFNIFDNASVENIFPMFKTTSPKLNKKILHKFKMFTTSFEFISYYSQKDVTKINQLFTSFEETLTDLSNYNLNSLKFESEIDQYLSEYTNILIILDLLTKFKEKMDTILRSTKNYLSKIKLENESLDSYDFSINNLMESDRTIIRKYSRRSTKENTASSNLLFQINKNIKDIEKNLKNSNIENSFETPKFDEQNDNFNDQSMRSSLKINQNSDQNLEFGRIESQMSITKMIFTPVKHSKSNEVEYSLDFNNTENIETCQKLLRGKSEGFDKKSNLNNQIENNIEKEICFELLETVKNMYKSCLITSEQKVKLKQMIISKSNIIKEIYIKYKEDKNSLFKKLINLVENEI